MILTYTAPLFILETAKVALSCQWERKKKEKNE
jgi:hypothetical protein